MLKRKYYRHIFSDTLLHIKIVKLNIFPRPEEAMFDNWQKIVSLYQYLVLFLRKLNLHKDIFVMEMLKVDSNLFITYVCIIISE